jgi:hypothetical protein
VDQFVSADFATENADTDEESESGNEVCLSARWF